MNERSISVDITSSRSYIVAHLNPREHYNFTLLNLQEMKPGWFLDNSQIVSNTSTNRKCSQDPLPEVTMANKRCMETNN